MLRFFRKMNTGYQLLSDPPINFRARSLADEKHHGAQPVSGHNLPSDLIFVVRLKLPLLGQLFIFRTISHLRVLSFDIPAAGRGISTKETCFCLI